MKLDDMTIKEARELSNLFGKKQSKKVIEDGGIRIVILQRGWVVVGRYSQKGSDCALSGASVIRSWGTTKGIGEIALNGPTEKTILDPSPIIRFHEMVVVATIDCNEDKWEKHIK